jgi:hypothetical protein
MFFGLSSGFASLLHLVDLFGQPDHDCLQVAHMLVESLNALL